MPKFLDTLGNNKIAIGICGRCNCKVPYDDLMPDPNFPGLMVCADDLDVLDPWRLPARETEDITLEHPRPDVPINDFGNTALFGPQQMQPVQNGSFVIASPVTELGPTRTWQPNTWYNKGDTVTPQNVDDLAVQVPQVWLVCLQSGYSGDAPPVWPAQTGVLIRETP